MLFPLAGLECRYRSIGKEFVNAMTDYNDIPDRDEVGGECSGQGELKFTSRLRIRLESAWRRFASWFNRFWQPVWKRLRKFVSVPFLLMLVLSFTLWYAIKLGYTYQAEIPVVVNVDGNVFEVNCMVEGQGTRLFARRHYRSKPLELNWDDLDVSPSAINPGWAVISPYSLQNAISSRNTDIKILSVGPIPEIEL